MVILKLIPDFLRHNHITSTDQINTDRRIFFLDNVVKTDFFLLTYHEADPGVDPT